MYSINSYNEIRLHKGINGTKGNHLDRSEGEHQGAAFACTMGRAHLSNRRQMQVAISQTHFGLGEKSMRTMWGGDAHLSTMAQAC